MEARKLRMSLTRREVVGLGALSLSGYLQAVPKRFTTLPTTLAQMEKTNGGRLGVAVLDTATGEQSGYRHDEALDRAISIPPKPLLSHSPVSEAYAGATMTVGAMCEAILTDSDNTAANVLLDTVGGPPGITRFCRSIGDTATRLDRTELALNESLAGDPRDTTTPAAMVRDLYTPVLRSGLSQDSRNQLTQLLPTLPSAPARRPDMWPCWRKSGAS